MHTYMINASIKDAGAMSDPLFFPIGAVSQAYRPVGADLWQIRSRLTADEIVQRLREWLGGDAQLKVRELSPGEAPSSDSKGWIKGHLNSTRLALYKALQKI